MKQPLGNDELTLPARQVRKNRELTLPARPEREVVDLSLFIACYNEEENIIDTIETVVNAVESLGYSYELIIIDDDSRDRSVELVQSYQQTFPDLPIRLLINRPNQGLGFNFIQAAQLARGEYYKLVCGDNVESVETLERILSRMGEADLVLPYHEHCEGKSPFRMLLSRTYTRLVNIISGHRLRYYNGLALYRRANVVQSRSNSSGFGFQADLVTHLLDRGSSYVEVLCDARERAKGQSNALTLRNFLSVTRTLVGIGWRRLRQKWGSLAATPR